MELSADTVTATYYGVSAALIALLGWSGWRQGFARQFMTLLSIICAYAAAWWGGPAAAPIFDFLKYPPQITVMIASMVVGVATFLGIHGLRRLLFKPTAQHKSASTRLSYGILGALINVAFGVLLFLFTTGAIRAIATVAQSRLDDMEKEKLSPVPLPPEDPGPLVRSIAKLGGALDKGKSGEFLHRYDVAPAAHAFATLAKIGIMVSRPDAVERFLAYPGVKTLTVHPKLIAVKNDPEVFQLLNDASYFKLLRHEKVIALANDTEFNSLVKQMGFDQALEHALKGGKPAEKSPETAPPSALN